ncbi:alanine racemase [Williamsia sp. 1135]|uniref:alanine racemase n=1 Tax=Williamsia sp. 1135 TaxID=1889262 RepID=UPI000A1004DD|nr:alanine racemase [Williamsia sp. 1135]ORM25887.1 alanine racemase [Williamsia sp. 1135]
MNSPALEAHIDLSAVAHNIEILRSHTTAQIMAVVKADGYGHGAAQVARAALAAGTAELGVATIDEALAVRRDGVSAPILAWLHSRGSDFAGAIDADVQVGVSSPRQLDAVVAAARVVGRTASVTVKIDTGLARNGVAPAEWDEIAAGLAKAVAEQSIVLRGAMTHLVRGDEPQHPENDLQARRFDEAVADLVRVGARPQVQHIANSAATLMRPDLARDLVRPGIAVYGRSPAPEYGDFGLVPAMTLSAEVLSVKKIKAGQGVSYSHTWVAPRDTTVALLPAGYADGVPRLVSNQLRVHINGRGFPGVGRVCMDQMVVDVGPDGGGVVEGDRAILFGTGAGGGPTALDWAEAIGSIDYEIVSGIRGRTIRTYSSEPVGTPDTRPRSTHDIGAT